jgi:ABC-type lipoprotein export system ATPase subunit
MSVEPPYAMSVESPYAVEVDGLHKTYPVGDGHLPVLKGLSFRVRKGELLGIVGESGSGKSTLLHVLGALDSPSSGAVRVGGINPFAGRDAAVSHFRNRYVGFVFQHNNLLPEFSCEENVMMPGLIAGFSRNQVQERARVLLDSVGLTKRRGHFPGMMSGGEQQRTALARALINSPTLLLADEPSGNLDSQNASKVHGLFSELNEKFNTTILVVTHNMEFARQLPRRIEMRDGEIIADVAGFAH